MLVVGGGPGGMASAIRLAQIAKAASRELTVLVIEKAKEVGAHTLSGAVMDPRALRELIPDFRERGAPIASDVVEDFVYFMTEHDVLSLPVIPRPLRNHGNLIVSLCRLVRWMGEEAGKLGVEVYPGFPAVDLLVENDRVVGVRTGDKGVDKHGKAKANFEAGVDIRAKVTVVAEGTRGSLTRILVERFKLDAGRNPQTYSTGVKEIWDFPAGHVHKGRVIHTMGWPLKGNTFGGGFLYGMSDTRLAVGFVVGLDSPDPFMDTHHEFQRFKTHPKIRAALDGGQMVEYGAKTLPSGGWFAMPKLCAAGAMIVGDGGSLLDAIRLKGVHTAIKSGMLAAETAFESIDDPTEAKLARYEERVRASYVGRELYRSRFFKHGFKRGLVAGMFNTAIGELTGGWSPLSSKMDAGHLRMESVAEYHGEAGAAPERLKFDEKLTFSKTTDVYQSGTIHDEDSPCHLKVSDLNICVDRCAEEFGNPCQHFCPAAVYEWVGEGKKGRLQINFSNCVHCKTCDIMDPYGIIQWVPPEGGGGPAWKNL